MARTANPILVPPADSTEACLRIQQAMPGTKATFRIVTNIPSDDVAARMFRGEEIGALLTYESGSVDVTDYLEAVQKNDDGTLKRPGGGENAWASPFLWDTYKNGPEALDYLGDVETDTSEPRKKRPEEKPRLKTASQVVDQAAPERIEKRIAESGNQLITPEDLLAMFDRAKINEPMKGSGEAAAKALKDGLEKRTYDRDKSYVRREPYKPMESGVWIDAGVNEDDVVATHPDPLKEPQAFYDSTLGKVPAFAVEPQVDVMKKLTEAVNELTRLIKGNQNL